MNGVEFCDNRMLRADACVQSLQTHTHVNFGVLELYVCAYLYAIKKFRVQMNVYQTLNLFVKD